MIKQLKAVVLWLEARFPEKVMLTFKEFNELHEELGALNKAYQALNQELDTLRGIVAEVEKVKAEVSKLHVVLGFSSGRGSNAPLER